MQLDRRAWISSTLALGICQTSHTLADGPAPILPPTTRPPRFQPTQRQLTPSVGIARGAAPHRVFRVGPNVAARPVTPTSLAWVPPAARMIGGGILAGAAQAFGQHLMDMFLGNIPAPGPVPAPMVAPVGPPHYSFWQDPWVGNVYEVILHGPYFVAASKPQSRFPIVAGGILTAGQMNFWRFGHPQTPPRLMYQGTVPVTADRWGRNYLVGWLNGPTNVAPVRWQRIA